MVKLTSLNHGCHSANVLKSANQEKHKPNVKKSKKLGSDERLASPRPSKPRTCLRWLPTGRIFDLCGKITASNNTESESDTSVCDNASASNPQEPTSKGFPNSTFFLDRLAGKIRSDSWGIISGLWGTWSLQFLLAGAVTQWTSRWRFHHIPVELQSRPHTHYQNQVTRSMLRKIVSLQVMSKDEYFGKKCSSQEVSNIISRLKIKILSLKVKDIKSKIKIQDYKHAKGTSKEFPSIQGSKIQDVTRSKAISAMTTP
ncbi:hypothetical protein Tco_0924043 [Tanacetum coccineum]|uniref:Uncharacterized protein n=1 Tax=Tanacetum coccineum TaxID=301880 RepID=A0ABQ5D9R8_9ASTR